jgi:integrase
MVAEALYRQIRHTSSQVVTDLGDVRAGARAGMVRAEAVKGLTQTELALLKTYEASGAHSASIEEEIRHAPGSQANTTLRDLEAIVRDTPATYWMNILTNLLEEIQDHRASGEDEGARYHTLVLDTFLHAFLLSTGCRISEPTHVRMDVHFEERHELGHLIRLRPVDRKNNRAHEVVLRADFLPDWLYREYIDRTRPFFLKGSADTPFLFVNAHGEPFGCPEENVDGTGRAFIEWEARKGRLATRWKNRMVRTATAMGLNVPSRHGHFSPHCVRKSMGHAICHSHGLEAAASYLGDKVATVESTYASLTGLHVDSGEVARRFRRSEVTEPREPLAPDERDGHEYGSELRDLTRLLGQGHLSVEEFAEAKAALNRRFGRGHT